MLLGHTSFAEQAFQDARLDAIHNIEFAETGFGMTFTLGTEVATGGANVSPSGDSLSATFSIGAVDIFAYGDVDTGSNTSYSNVSTGSNDTYSDVATGSNTSYSDAA